MSAVDPDVTDAEYGISRNSFVSFPGQRESGGPIWTGQDSCGVEGDSRTRLVGWKISLSVGKQ